MAAGHWPLGGVTKARRTRSSRPKGPPAKSKDIKWRFDGAHSEWYHTSKMTSALHLNFSVVFLNSLLFCVVSTVQWCGATSICDGIIIMVLKVILIVIMS